MPFSITLFSERFFALDETEFERSINSAEIGYRDAPIQYGDGLFSNFNAAKSQLIELIDKIIEVNPSLGQPGPPQGVMRALKENIEANLQWDTPKDHKVSILVGVKKHLEMMYLDPTLKASLKEMSASEVSDLEFTACFPGAFSNMVEFFSRVDKKSASFDQLLAIIKHDVAKGMVREFITHHSEYYSGNEVHEVNRYLNLLSPYLGFPMIEDSYAGRSVEREDEEALFNYLKEHRYSESVLNFLMEAYPFPSEYDQRALDNLEKASLEGAAKTGGASQEHERPLITTWTVQRLAEFYDPNEYKIVVPDDSDLSDDEKDKKVSEKTSRIQRLVMMSILHEKGFLKEEAYHQYPFSDHQNVYMIEDDIFLEEETEDEVLIRPLEEVEDCSIDMLDRLADDGCFGETSLQHLPQDVILGSKKWPLQVKLFSLFAKKDPLTDETKAFLSDCLSGDAIWYLENQNGMMLLYSTSSRSIMSYYNQG